MSSCLLRNESRRARKDHRCDNCYMPIRVGERYIIEVSVDRGDFWLWRECEACRGYSHDGAAYDGLTEPGSVADQISECDCDACQQWSATFGRPVGGGYGAAKRRPIVYYDAAASGEGEQ